MQKGLEYLNSLVQKSLFALLSKGQEKTFPFFSFHYELDGRTSGIPQRQSNQPNPFWKPTNPIQTSNTALLQTHLFSPQIWSFETQLFLLQI